MTATEIYKIFRETQPELSDKVATYKEIRGSSNEIELIMTGGRFGYFKVEPCHFTLTISDRKLI